MNVSTGIAYLTGDATKPVGSGSKIIAHICNDEGKWGKGFVLALSKRWKQPETQFRQWSNQTPRPQLGEVQFTQVEPDLWVANIIGQHGVRISTAQSPIRYPAVEQGLSTLANFAKLYQASVHMPRIGCGLAGGSWHEIEPIITRTLVQQGIDVTVYDFPS